MLVVHSIGVNMNTILYSYTTVSVEQAEEAIGLEKVTLEQYYRVSYSALWYLYYHRVIWSRDYDQEYF